MNAKTKHFATVALIKAAAQHFQTEDRVFIGSCGWEGGEITVEVTLEDFEIWHTLAHIYNVAEAASMLLSGLYDEDTGLKVFRSKRASETILASDSRLFGVSQLLRVDKVIKGFLKTFANG